MIRSLFALLISLTVGQAALAERFQGRSYLTFDGRGSDTAGPLIVMLHGAYGTGRQLKESANFDPIAKRYSAYVIYPTAPKRLWNDGRFVDGDHSDVAARDDVAYLSALVDRIVKQGKARRDQIYVIGHSNGGGMATRWSCERPDLLAGIGVVSTKILIAAPCKSPRPIPALLFYGTKDRVAPHAGRSAKNSKLPPGNYTLSGAKSVAVWRDRNGCTARAKTTNVNADARDGVTVRRSAYRGCRKALVYYEMVGGGHAFPGADPVRIPFIRRAIGGAINDIHAGAEAMKLWFGR